MEGSDGWHLDGSTTDHWALYPKADFSIVADLPQKFKRSFELNSGAWLWPTAPLVLTRIVHTRPTPNHVLQVSSSIQSKPFPAILASNGCTALMARLPRLYAPRIPQLLEARFARALAPADAPTPEAALNTITTWLAAEAHTFSRPTRLPSGSTQPLTAAVAGTNLPAVAMHAWAVLPDRITLLATPGDPRSLSRLMQALGRRMGSGLLRTRVYAGRYHNALLEPGRWVLPAMLWVESLPAQTGLVTTTTQWPWSSAAEHAGQASEFTGFLLDHPDYWHEGDTPFARQAAWRKQLATGLPAVQSLQIEAALHGQWALGEKIFLSHLGRLASRRVSPAPRGRPRKIIRP